MGLLSQSQKDAFWKDGVLVVEDAVSDAQLEQLRTVLFAPCALFFSVLSVAVEDRRDLRLFGSLSLDT